MYKFAYVRLSGVYVYRPYRCKMCVHCRQSHIERNVHRRFSKLRANFYCRKDIWKTSELARATNPSLTLNNTLIFRSKFILFQMIKSKISINRSISKKINRPINLIQFKMYFFYKFKTSMNSTFATDNC